MLGADERPLDRYSAAAQQEPITAPTTPPDDGSTLGYLLETDVPVYYFPLVPDPTGQPTLSLLVLRRVGSDGQPHDVPPLGELLTALQRHRYSTRNCHPRERRSGAGTFSFAASTARCCCGPAANG